MLLEYDHTSYFKTYEAVFVWHHPEWLQFQLFFQQELFVQIFLVLAGEIGCEINFNYFIETVDKIISFLKLNVYNL